VRQRHADREAVIGLSAAERCSFPGWAVQWLRVNSKKHTHKTHSICLYVC